MIIRKGDTIQIRAGKDRGKTGKVLRVYPHDKKILIEGLNLYKKHRRPRKDGEKGEIITVPRPLTTSNVGFYCPTCKKAVRVGHRMEKDKKVRFCKSCSNVL
ncbi:MAG: 50S ribosomal protein L24 [Candidatus Harrisonbacteria bacterium CG10_big_fil_rev_8_21_14_0_10_42_17]|uniref:Large ribosomal subunit protein uL24 n=1 Tax=Candidatus Harrisonbacteria bacterium CG10_big_fil_rev_8_21_14_0_10_42_17 TaxID=1974584 RepID=A0A2M6WHL9_9BACT|nr:MAG: 50S ribosomal protein L24 [Candidatus Harrisonbacteria bacterium CG10_big_fil_rev_8_21_14_0_10_42_17]